MSGCHWTFKTMVSHIRIGRGGGGGEGADCMPVFSCGGKDLHIITEVGCFLGQSSAVVLISVDKIND